VEHDEVAVLVGPHVDFRAVAPEEAAVVVDPDLDRGIVRLRDGRLSRTTREEERKEQVEEHGASRELLVPY
jgi:hypothetical protein